MHIFPFKYCTIKWNAYNLFSAVFIQTLHWVFISHRLRAIYNESKIYSLSIIVNIMSMLFFSIFTFVFGWIFIDFAKFTCLKNIWNIFTNGNTHTHIRTHTKKKIVVWKLSINFLICGNLWIIRSARNAESRAKVTTIRAPRGWRWCALLYWPGRGA